MRDATRAMLEALGYQVVEAASGDEALAVLERTPEISFVFTDVIMASGMTGIELARSVMTTKPGLPILLTSGYTAQRMTPNAKNGDLPLLRKPYTLGQLAEAISRTVEPA